MRSKTVEKNTTDPRGNHKLSVVRKSKAMAKSPPLSQTKRRVRHSIANLYAQDDVKLKKGSTPTKSPKAAQSSDDGSKSPVKVKSCSAKKKETDKFIKGSKKAKGALKKNEKVVGGRCKVSPMKANPKNEKQLDLKTKGKSKKKDSSQKDTSQFIDIWALASIGKREASLNASMKVNIMYEKQVSPKKSSSRDSSPLKSKTSPSISKTSGESKGCVKEKVNATNKANASSPAKKNKLSSGKEFAKKTKPAVSSKKSDSLNKKSNEDIRKRKSQYKIYEDEPASKARKKDNDTRPTKAKSKKVVKKRKKNVLDHNLGNIIERSPRQASLNAKAMIAMEQEDDAPVETAARTKVYDWTEVRSCVVNDTRKMTWVTGSGDLKSLAQSKKVRKSSQSNDTSVSIRDVVESTGVEENNSHSLRNTLLKTIHEIGDARLLKEFLRSQKEDFPGDIDIERCPTPNPPPPPPTDPVKESSTPSPKKKSTPSKSLEPKKTPEKQMKKPIVPSPTKPCRVATPIPQFSPGQQRPSQISGFIHHPATHAQAIYPNFGDQQHQKQQPTPPPPQPIKVTPYAPSSAYVYQCSPANRQQQNIFVPNTPSPMPSFPNDANDLVPRNFPASFTFNQMGSLSFERRGLNPYQHPQGNAYPPSVHLPIQPIGFNFQQFYQPSIQQLHNQQNLPQSIQQVPLPAHQQYTLVPPPHSLPPPSVMQQSQPLPPAHLNPIRPFQQSTFSPYPNSAPATTNELKQDKSCMPPRPPCPVAQSLPQPQNIMTSIIQPLPSYRRAIPVSPQVQSPLKLIKPSPERLSSMTVTNTSCNIKTTIPSSVASHAFHNPSSQPPQLFKPVGSDNIVIHNPLPIRPVATVNASFRPIVCKKENKVTQQNCDKNITPEKPLESPKKSAVKNGSDESSIMSDILHSAHSTMFSAEEKSASDSPNHSKQRNLTVASTASPSSSKEFQLTTVLASSRSAENFNGSYSVTSILEMPTSKIKTEPKTKSCAINTEKFCPTDQKNKITKKEMYYLCIPPPKAGAKPGTSLLTTTAIPIKLTEERSIKQFPHSNEVIVIDDNECSSDDEPLAKLMQSKANESSNTKSVNIPEDKAKKTSNEVQKIKKVKNNPKALKIKLFEKKVDLKTSKLQEVKAKTNAKHCKDSKPSSKAIAHLKKSQVENKTLSSPPLKTKQPKDKGATTSQSKAKQLNTKNQKAKKMNDTTTDKALVIVTAKDSVKKDEVNGSCNVKVGGDNSAMVPALKKQGSKVVKKAPIRRKSKTQAAALIPPALPKTKAIHGWSWIGEGEWKMIPKLTQLKEESLRLRKCFKSMKHTFGEVISVKDCVILQSDGDGSVPYVGKVSALWENLNGDMMFSMLWYYQPEHTAAGREPEDGEQELFASKHREENSVACIDDKCYVLMYNEFCRMEADAMRSELGVPTPSSHLMIPSLSEEDRSFLRPLPPPDIGMDNIWFCRYDYDTRKKIVRKPKHKKTDLRYRGPCKLVQ